MNKEETIVYAVNSSTKYSKDGHFVDMPPGWEFVPSGNPALTRRLKTSAPDYWIVMRKFGRKEFGVGLCVPSGLADGILEQIEIEHDTPEYQKKLESSRKRREKQQAEYQEDFEAAVIDFLSFHERWHDLAVQFAKAVTAFTTPVGSGTVARTKRIPIEERARAAVIAWMRHNTTDYDRRYIPRIAGKRHDVRRELAHESLALLTSYRNGFDAPQDCPLQKALSKQNENNAKPLSHKPKGTDFWL